MTWHLADLPWLPRAPRDFRDRCAAVDKAGGGRGEDIMRLASHALDEKQLTRLAKTVARAREGDEDPAPLTPFRLAILSNATTGLLAPALVGSAARHGIALDIVETAFGQAVQMALDPNSDLHTARPDAVLIAFDHRIVPTPTLQDDADQARECVEAAFGQIATIRKGLRAAGGAPTIIQTIPPPPESLLGSFDARLPGSRRRLIEKLNEGLVQSLEGTPDILLDAVSLAEAVGLEPWHDERQWHLAKLSFSASFLPLYADHIGRLLGAVRGKSRKCLVLDLDNTIWGGVVGDDGVEGIVLGQGDPTGEAFLAVQRTALALRDHGVVLAVCSKNEEEMAREPFREHPDMVLAEKDIAVFQANWNDKASNLEAIAEALNIGTDALVLVDDNPAERALVREELPMIAVPELPEDPTLFSRAILAAGYFETVTFSSEDRGRAGEYQANARRVALKTQKRDLGAYLESLGMEIRFAPFDGKGRSRIAQLINKSNQFNLTTRRYTEAQVAAMEEDSRFFTLQVRLKDTFGDAGMISVVICRIDGTTWDVDLWLMSCRVLGRRVEEAVLRELVHHAGAGGAEALVGTYIPTARNGLVREHYTTLGFEEAATQGDTTRWRLELSRYEPPTLPMAVTRHFMEEAA